MKIREQTKTLKNSIEAQKKRYVSLGILLGIGILIGVFFALILSKGDKAIIKTSLDAFFKSVNADDLNYLSAFYQSLFNLVVPAILIWILGISIIGAPIILFFDFFKGFLVGFSFSSILITYHWKGILKAIFYVFPHQVLGLFLTIFLCFYALRFSGKLASFLFLKKEIDLKRAMKRYVKVLGIVVIGFCFLSLLEVFLAPVLLRLV